MRKKDSFSMEGLSHKDTEHDLHQVISYPNANLLILVNDPYNLDVSIKDSKYER